jgi:hypothetical protein
LPSKLHFIDSFLVHLRHPFVYYNDSISSTVDAAAHGIAAFALPPSQPHHLQLQLSRWTSTPFEPARVAGKVDTGTTPIKELLFPNHDAKSDNS